MDFLRFSIINPVKVAVGVIIILLFGVVALINIPIQLTPNVDQPKITITTNWTGRSPEEVEKEIVEEQEDKLSSVQGLRKMKATASLGAAVIELEFNIGTDMTRALQEVSDKLREVPEYPDQVDEPVIQLADSASGDANAIAWLLIQCDDPNQDIQELYDDVDKRVKPYLERVPGLSEINIYGGREREVHVRIDPRRMAERGITFSQLHQALRQENVNASAGEIEDGRLDVRVRVVGQFDQVESVRETVVATTPGGQVRVRDLGDVELTLQKRRTFVRANGRPALALSVIRESNSNVIAVMEGLRERINEVNERRDPNVPGSTDGMLEQILPGKNLRLEQVYDETVYIYDALALVKDNIWQGGALAVLVLLVFLRAIRPTIIIAISIPISLIGTFVVMAAAGRNINVISLAGLAFASGNVVNAAIVVLENIDRHLGMGKSPLRAAYDGTREVWPSVFNTTLTTLVVFLPVIFMQEEAGQLFRDISLAICASVGLSMLVAVTVIPSAAARFLRPHRESRNPMIRATRSLFGLAEPVGKVANGIAGTVDRLNRQPLIGGPVRVIVSLVGFGLTCFGIALVVWRANQGDLFTFKTLLMPVWIEILGAVLVLCGLALAAYGAGAKAIKRGTSRMTAVDVGTLVVTGAVLAACGVWLIAAFSGDGTLQNLKIMVLACAALLAGLLVAAIGMALLPARIAVVSLFTFGSLLGAWLLMPPTTYLPSGNRNLVFGMMLTPPSYGVEHNQYIADRVETNLRPYWEARTMEDTTKLPPARALDFATMQVSELHAPPIKDYFFVSWNGQVFMGAASANRELVHPLGPLLSNAMEGVPGSFGFATQMSIFGMDMAGSNSIQVEISGNDLHEVRAAAGALFMQLSQKYGQILPAPMNFNLAGPEMRVTIDRVRAADMNVDVSMLGLGVQALVDGAVVGDYRHAGDAIDILVVRDPTYALTPDTLGAVPVAYKDAQGNTGTVPLSSIANITHEAAPQEILRIEEMRAVSLTVNLPPGVPLETATTEVRELSNQLKKDGVIPRSVLVEPAGTADKLTQVRRAMFGEWKGWNLESLKSLVQSRMLLAMVITYLLMAALFESFLYPFVIMFTVPLATIGGFMGLALVHATDHNQLFDVLTMLGFVILIGIVVDNATLLVYQALNYMKGFGESEQDVVARLSPREAIRESVRTRLRPIMMASLTNFFGTLPLVLMPGAGSELYKGLGAVVLGGMLVATVFTLLVVPLVFSMTLDLKIWVYRRRGWPVPELGEGDRIETPAAVPTPA